MSAPFRFPQNLGCRAMNWEKNMIEQMQLDNGLRVEFYDYSRKVAGDRWLVGLLVKIPMKVERSDFIAFDNGDSLYNKFLEENGPDISFQLQKERNFIDEREKAEVFGAMLENLKKHALSYMAHPEFSSSFKHKTIQEFRERLSWWQ